MAMASVPKLFGGRVGTRKGQEGKDFSDLQLYPIRESDYIINIT